MKTFTSNPTVNNDTTQGYRVGEQWINTSTGTIFICTDVTTGAAVWIPKANAILTTTDITVAASGGDYTSVADALASLRNKWIATDVYVNIVIADGTYNVNAAITPMHPQGTNIVIMGQNTYSKTMSSVQSSSVFAGAWSIIINLNNVTNTAVNDYVVISAPSSGTHPTYIAGCHKVTNVDAGNSRITITSTHPNATAPSGNITATVTVMKTILNFNNNTDGLDVWGHVCTNIKDFVLVGPAGSYVGINVQDGGSRLYSAGTIGIVGFITGVYVGYNAEYNGTVVASSGATTNSFEAELNSSLLLIPTGIATSSTYGFRCNTSSMAIQNSISTGQTQEAFGAYYNGYIDAANSIASASTRGYCQYSGGYIRLDSVSVDTNTTDYNNVSAGIATGAILPVLYPAPYQYFLHTPTGRAILMQYNGSTWTPQQSQGAITMYVDATGTDDQNHGYGTGTSAYATLTYAVTQLPPTLGENVTINVATGTFTAPTIQGKCVSGNYTITIQGTWTTTVAGLTATGGIQGTAPSTYAYVTDTNAAWGIGTVAASGTTTSTSANHLVDTGANFTTTAKIGMVVNNTTDGTWTVITVINSATDLTLDTDIMASAETYQIGRGAYSGKFILFASNTTTSALRSKIYVIDYNTATTLYLVGKLAGIPINGDTFSIVTPGTVYSGHIYVQNQQQNVIFSIFSQSSGDRFYVKNYASATVQYGVMGAGDAGYVYVQNLSSFTMKCIYYTGTRYGFYVIYNSLLDLQASLFIGPGGSTYSPTIEVLSFLTLGSGSGCVFDSFNYGLLVTDGAFGSLWSNDLYSCVRNANTGLVCSMGGRVVGSSNLTRTQNVTTSKSPATNPADSAYIG